MWKPFAALLALGATLAPLPAAAGLDAGKARAVLARAVDEGIRPGYRAFRADAVAMAEAMKTLCAAPSADHRAKADKAFAALVAGWGRVEIVRLGPALEKNRFERVLFYPDRKGLGLKQTQAILKAEDPAALTSLSGKSVAVQGLGALDYVLAGSGAEALLSGKDSYRCRFGAAIADNIADIAGELDAAWAAPGGIADNIRNPGPDNPLYRTEAEAMTALLGIFVHGAETVRDQRIEPILRGAEAEMRPRAALFWRSRNTWTAVTANLDGLHTLWTKAGMASLLPEDAGSVSSSITFVMKSMRALAARLEPDMERLAADPAGRGRIDYLLVNGRDLILRLSDDYGKAIGLGAGFSFADGD